MCFKCAPLVLRRPLPPLELAVPDASREHISVTWKPPTKDGGSPISGYHVEVAEARPELKWLRVNTRPIKELSFRIDDGIKPEKKYVIRVRAINTVGVSDPSDVSDKVFTKDPDCAPTLDLASQEVVVVEGEKLQLKVPYRAIPTPKMVWKKDEVECKAGERLSMTVEMNSAHLDLLKSSRADAGAYAITLENSLGSATGTVTVKSITVTWKAPDSDGGCPITGYIVEKMEKDGDRFDRVTPTLVPGLSHTVTDKPGPPVNITFEDVRNTSVVLNWEPPLDDGGSEVLNYILEKKDNRNEEVGWITVSSTLKTPTHAVTKLIEGKEYVFRVTAENRFGCGPPNTSKPLDQNHTFSGTRNRGLKLKRPPLPTDPPDAPSTPRVHEVTASSAKISWHEPKDNGSPILGYWIERKEVNSKHWTRVNRALLNSLDVRVEGLMEGLTYIFRVCAENLAGPGSFSEPSERTVAMDAIKTPAVSLDASVRSGVILRAGEALRLPALVSGRPQPEVKWSKDEKDLEAEHMLVETQGRNTTLCIKKAVRADTGLFRVTGTNTSGTKSAECRVDVMDVPGPVVDLKTVQVTKKNITLTWSDPLDNGGSDVLGYEVLRKDAKMKLFRQPMETASCKCDITGLLAGEEYDFRVIARNKFGDGTPADLGPILAKLHYTDRGKSSISLAWEVPRSDGGSPILGYVLEKMRSDSSEFEPASRKMFPECCGTLENLSENMEYEFRVHAVTEVGDGDNCKPISFRLKAENKYGVSDGCDSEKVELKDPFGLPGPPRNPKILRATATTMTVTWEPPLDNGGSSIQGYWLEKRERGAVYWGRVNRAPVTKPSVKGLQYTVLKLIEGSVYQFRIAACNAAGVGPHCEPTECKLAMEPCSDPPGSPEVKDKTKSSVTLSWIPPDRDGGSPIKGYIIEVHEEGSPDWRRVNPADKLHPLTEITVPDLKEGKKCRFRIYAVNAAGNSDPAKTGDVLSKLNHSGRFIINAENAAGHKLLKVRVTVLDLPGAPRDLKVSDVTRGTCRFTWKAPESDGGERVKSYFIEKKAVNGKAWTKVQQERRGHHQLPGGGPDGG
ncbi:hypothetical protein F7725_002694 [Dissostichus mawsoni]|uniref:Titin n=1 Tax=Dissostichus mawsoni TaxID=36200 RepID=A0A7J5Y336_DISMA|nr:hypothetical protein F7725_002694 [Dissostichus mawsoni]